MAKKSKTQRAKASAARAARKEARIAAEQEQESQPAVVAAEEPKKGFFRRKKAEATAPASTQVTKSEKKDETPAKKKKKKGFLSNVRAEMKRVTWPTKPEVLRWSVVVVCALLFFGVCVAVLDNVIITPVLVGIAGLGA